MWVSGVFSRYMEHWLKWWLFFSFSDLFQCRLVWWKRKKRKKKNPQLDTTPPTRLASCEPNQATSETSAAKPIGRCAALADWRRGSAGRNPHASSLWAVSHEPWRKWKQLVCQHHFHWWAWWWWWEERPKQAFHLNIKTCGAHCN